MLDFLREMTLSSPALAGIFRKLHKKSHLFLEKSWQRIIAKIAIIEIEQKKAREQSGRFPFHGEDPPLSY
ncbi:hypothetical protein [Acidobacterium sp. S8]|uniref:hypothetical protein n=1 Tax=Acidobacterium sp. S8 TaxID=1641854 RepID=UPI00131CB1F1|nr:hypothetical protein [Acidobacterium sp. S8]